MSRRVRARAVLPWAALAAAAWLAVLGKQYVEGAKRADHARDVYPARVAGSFYPSNPGELGDTLDDLLEKAEAREIPGRLIGLVVPHAAVKYSGAVAAAAYRLIEGRRYDRVVVLGPSHHAREGRAATLDTARYATPLGEARLAAGFLRRITGEDAGVEFRRDLFDDEHSVEV
ncbi:MAG: AmmeMemoRadiSam system protein B, partial [Myxococcales bacterium]|nr:AmmeMemoRadiSam system protein B [Myxococcales bacterium]